LLSYFGFFPSGAKDDDEPRSRFIVSFGYFA
jgi:hypothetical protein